MRSLAQPAVRLWREAERSRAILPMMVCICLACTSSSMLMTVVSLQLGEPGTDPRLVQMVLTAYPLGFLLGCIVTRTVVGRFGHQRSFQIAQIVAMAASAGFVATDFVPAWMLFRLAGGLSMASIFVICESWINLYALKHDRGALFSLYMLSLSISLLMGQLLVGAMGARSPQLLPVAALIALAGVGIHVFGRAWPALPVASQVPAGARAVPSERLSVAALFRLAPVTVVAICLSGITNMNVFVLTPIYGTQIGLPATTTVALVTALSVGCLVAQTPVGWFSDRFDRRVTLLVQGLLSVALCVAIALTGSASPFLLIVLFFLYGGIALTIYPVAIAYANSRMDSRHMVAASGTLLLLYSVGNVATPGLASGMMEQVGPAAMFLILGSGAVLVALAAVYTMRVAAPVPELGPEAGTEPVRVIEEPLS